MTKAVLAFGLLLALAQQAFAASGNPQKHLTTAGTHLAVGALLVRGDLGAAAWKAKPAPGTSAPNCGIESNIGPMESDLTEVGAASGPVFTNAGTEALDQFVTVFSSPAQANTAWQRTVNKTFVICMEQQVENTSSMGAPVSVTNWKQLKLPGLSGHAVGYRVIATATGTNAKVNVYFDQILIHRSSTLTKLVFSSFGKPFSTAYEMGLARQVSQRLG